jgi:DNA modification methylase
MNTELKGRKLLTQPVRSRSAHLLEEVCADIRNLAPVFYCGDARNMPFLPDSSIDLVVTSPPYWHKRDYGHRYQIGQEATPDQYIKQLMRAFREWKRILKPTGSVFLNVADSFVKGQLAGIPAKLELALMGEGWRLVNRIVWTKDYGVPEAHAKLAQRHEFVLHFAPNPHHFIDLFAFANAYGGGFNPGDVWRVRQTRSRSSHPAPYPMEIASRAITLACPERVCPQCGRPLKRRVERTFKLNPERPQARRAMALYQASDLTPEHIAAIQATGISDTGMGAATQNGAGRNSERVRELAEEAKTILGGYFREFTFPLKRQTGWRPCECGCRDNYQTGVVLDPFMGTGTTMEAAYSLGRLGVGVDLKLPKSTGAMRIQVCALSSGRPFSYPRSG